MNIKSVSAQDGKIIGTDEAWENGTLGADERYVARSPSSSGASVDDALALKPISIRLPETMVEDLRVISKLNGLRGYQPLIRQVLTRFVKKNKKKK